MRRIVRLDVKKDWVVKGQQYEGYKKIAPLNEVSSIVAKENVEVFYYDLVATLFGRNSVLDSLDELLERNFIPVTVGGGIDSAEKVDACFSCGVDRIAMNSICFKDSQLISHVAQTYGSQACIVHIEAKKLDGKWCAMHTSGRELGNRDILEHVQHVQNLGAGEIVISSIDNDGMLNGFPKELLHEISEVIRLPVVVSGGLKSFDDFQDLHQEFRFVSAVCISKAYLKTLAL